MKFFISYSKEDKKYAEEIAQVLIEDGHKVFYDAFEIKFGDNIFEKIEGAIKDSDAIIQIISKNSLNSEWVRREFSSQTVKDISNKKQRILPVKIDDSVLPNYLATYAYLDLSSNFSDGINTLRRLVSKMADSEDGLPREKKKVDNKERNKQLISEVSASLKEGKLTLVCGAGVSIGAGIPTWNDLLIRLLESMLNKFSEKDTITFKGINPIEIQKRLGPSAIVMGKYLKSNLGKDFLSELRNALYADNPQTCDIIDAIVEISRPQRDGRPLDSIVTFNFDTLIEENLDANNIKHSIIHKEGLRNKPNELPIYHVHGYLPRKGKLTSEMDVVFSEDAYHTQFIDPFSWSNLIQLNKLSQNTCLLLGLSLTDPNLRRLLDVAIRKDPSKRLNHFIIKKTPNFSGDQSAVDEFIMFLEEQDANELGLNVIWIDDFSEIASILKAIYNR
jgi:hypothetical protein